MNKYPEQQDSRMTAREVLGGNSLPKRDLSILLELDNLDKTIKFLEEVSERLANRLTPIVRAIETDAAPRTPTANRDCELASKIAVKTEALHNIASNLDSVFNRIEL